MLHPKGSKVQCESCVCGERSSQVKWSHGLSWSCTSPCYCWQKLHHMLFPARSQPDTDTAPEMSWHKQTMGFPVHLWPAFKDKTERMSTYATKCVCGCVYVGPVCCAVIGLDGLADVPQQDVGQALITHSVELSIFGHETPWTHSPQPVQMKNSWFDIEISKCSRKFCFLCYIHAIMCSRNNI